MEVGAFHLRPLVCGDKMCLAITEEFLGADISIDVFLLLGGSFLTNFALVFCERSFHILEDSNCAISMAYSSVAEGEIARGRASHCSTSWIASWWRAACFSSACLRPLSSRLFILADLLTEDFGFGCLSFLLMSCLLYDWQL